MKLRFKFLVGILLGSLCAQALLIDKGIGFYFECTEVSENCVEVPYTGLAEASLKIKKDPEMVVTQSDVEHAEIHNDQHGRPEIMIALHREAKEKFAQLTSRNIGKRLVIVVAKRAMLAAVIRIPIPGGRLQISEASGKDDHFLESLPWLKKMSDDSQSAERFWNLFSILAYASLGICVLWGGIYFAYLKRKVR